MSLPPYLKPGDKVVLYDQHCRFCTLWSGFRHAAPTTG